jgi:hypothetical protein
MGTGRPASQTSVNRSTSGGRHDGTSWTTDHAGLGDGQVQAARRAGLAEEGTDARAFREANQRAVGEVGVKSGTGSPFASRATG